MSKKRAGFPVQRARSKGLPLHPEVWQALEQQFEAFRRRFGREPGPSHPVFFDPDAEQPGPLSQTRMEEELVRAATVAGIDPAIIFAYVKTGMLVTSHNLAQWSPEDLAEWDAAVAEGRRAAQSRN